MHRKLKIILIENHHKTHEELCIWCGKR